MYYYYYYYYYYHYYYYYYFTHLITFGLHVYHLMHDQVEKAAKPVTEFFLRSGNKTRCFKPKHDLLEKINVSAYICIFTHIHTLAKAHCVCIYISALHLYPHHCPASPLGRRTSQLELL